MPIDLSALRRALIADGLPAELCWWAITECIEVNNFAIYRDGFLAPPPLRLPDTKQWFKTAEAIRRHVEGS